MKFWAYIDIAIHGVESGGSGVFEEPADAVRLLRERADCIEARWKQPSAEPLPPPVQWTPEEIARAAGNLELAP